ncbi:MAG: histidine-type phosphatase [Butyrivibrio sp.]|uniref:histidine-type phosphatase n=1 Tax=Butyrivibrio sp. TaxID=28121 RepID=UPI001B6AFEE5|nr:histidine-type phosphatase [Butyrivibrio sp.]MBP3784517.1 histidine-type phosphatase [Butyrivibrio sp.]
MNTYFTRGRDQNKSRLLSVVLIIALLFCCTGLSGCGKKSGKALSEYWAADSEAAESLRQYVSKVTNKKDSENFIPVEDRIAVFDMDGTLTCETYYTYYDTMMFINYCLEDHPERVSDDLKAAAAEIKPGYTAGEELARNFAKAYAGMTVKELYDYAVEFGQKETDSFNNMKYIDGFYLPMVEVVKYLYDNNFTIYVVSGTERTTSRAIVANSPIRDYVSPAHVIGTEFEVKVKGNEDVSSNMDFKYADGDELVFTGGFIQKNLNANKTIWIEREIGQYPVLAFGNSGSDTSMMNYALDKRNPYPSEAYMVVADDDVREWGTQNWEEKSAAYKEQGYVPISMKNDFLKIYPDAITRAENQYVEKETEAAQADNIIQFPSKTEGSASEDENVRATLSREGFTLEKSVVLSRHNIRAPLSGAGSALSTITPHKWFDWSAPASQLSVRGGTLETEMGQYFRKWLEKEGLFEPNYRPEDEAVRIYANSKQRTIATAEFFAAGLLPVDGIDVEYHSDFDTMDPVFNPVFTFASDDYAADATEEIIEKFGPVIEDLSDNYSLLEDVIDVKESDDYKSGSFTGFDTGDDEFAIEEGKEPSVSGSLKKACQISDALVLQYFEEEDEKKAAFDHDLTTEQWEAISEIKDVYGDTLFTAPLIATNVAHPLLQEIESELTADGRQFSFLCGHDSNLASVIAALDVSDYSLPDTIEKKTPIGAKLVINTWKDGSGEEYITLDLVYQKTEQLRSMSILDDNNPPGIYTLHLNGIKADENGMYKAKDVLDRFKSAIEAYDLMIEEYQQEGAA